MQQHKNPEIGANTKVSSCYCFFLPSGSRGTSHCKGVKVFRGQDSKINGSKVSANRCTSPQLRCRTEKLRNACVWNVTKIGVKWHWFAVANFETFVVIFAQVRNMYRCRLLDKIVTPHFWPSSGRRWKPPGSAPARMILFSCKFENSLPVCCDKWSLVGLLL